MTPIVLLSASEGLSTMLSTLWLDGLKVILPIDQAEESRKVYDWVTTFEADLSAASRESDEPVNVVLYNILFTIVPFPLNVELDDVPKGLVVRKPT